MTTTTALEHDEGQNHLATLIAAHEGRLRLLQVRAAHEGRNTPPDVLSEIERIEAEIAHLRQNAAVAPLSAESIEELGPVGRYQVAIGNIMRLDGDIGAVRRDLEVLRAHDDKRMDEMQVQINRRIDDLQTQINSRIDNLIIALSAAHPATSGPPRRQPNLRPVRKGR